MPPRTPFFLTSPLVWAAFAAGSLGFAADIARSRPRSAAVPAEPPSQPPPPANEAAEAPPAMDPPGDQKPPEVAGEKPTQAAAARGYETYVEGWKRKEGLPEEAVRQVVASQHRGSAAAAEAALGTAEGARPPGADTETVPLSESTDFMVERSRK